MCVCVCVRVYIGKLPASWTPLVAFGSRDGTVASSVQELTLK